MRTELLDQIATIVNGFHVRPEVDYDYENVRKRLIFEGLTQAVQYVCNNAVEGDIAEFGTGSGFSAYSIARAMSFYQGSYAHFMRQLSLPRKTLRLFDSFKGLPRAGHEIDLASPNVQSGRWGEGTFTGLTREELYALCGVAYDKERIEMYEGWYRDTLRTVPASTKFAMLHIDCDLYSSTVEVLDPLFSQGMFADGCMICFDDWNCNRSSPRFGQRRAWRELTQKHGVEYSDNGDYAIVGHKFTVHVG